SISYKDAGVDIDAGAKSVDAIKSLVQSTYSSQVIGDIGGFGGLFDVSCFKDMKNPILVSGTDGVGTKLKLAQMSNIHNTVGIDLVAMCANDIVVCGAHPLFFLDYIAIGKVDPNLIKDIVSGIADGCKQASCSLIGGETAEHPGVMAPNDYDLSGFCVGVVDKDNMLGSHKVEIGDVILGLSSSGIHSNGYSLVRKAVIEQMSSNMLNDTGILNSGQSLMQALLSPTKIYVKPLLKLLLDCPSVCAFSHITGGGITYNLDRVLPSNANAQIKLGSWPSIDIIDFVCKQANISQKLALETFNMGIGMCVICKKADLELVTTSLENSGEAVYNIGKIVKGSGVVEYV
ncbi:MAG: phosphoribosylformylglycinamidine cyclo-ligase, partial [Coriobacteriales bacterium]|nr:phosphoribosylformylglycinamidine cyclo-ligase [Coriobacteriales bacterium]